MQEENYWFPTMCTLFALNLGIHTELACVRCANVTLLH